MTLIAAIFNRKGQPLGNSACASLRQTISRNGADEAEIFRAHVSGWRDYRYAIEAAHTYYSYWKKCGGNFSLSVS